MKIRKMDCVNSDKFSATDLTLFIESIEKITRMEEKKKKRLQQRRAQYLANTMRYLDQQYPASSSSTLSSTDDPEDESVLENIEEKQIDCYHYAVKDLLGNSNHEEKLVLSYDECTNVIQNDYCQIGGDGDPDNTECSDNNNSIASDIYSIPLDSLESTKISRSLSCNNLYEQISPVRRSRFVISKESIDSYTEPLNVDTTAAMDLYTVPLEVVTGKKSLKKTLLGLVCKKYRKRYNSKNSNNWCKSESWMKLTVV